jgi:iron complex outermembrane receptor protein
MSKRLLTAFLTTASLAAAGPAFAQAGGVNPNSDDTTVAMGLERVVVTARKREEEAQVVPISITALTQADLDRLSVKTI